MKTLIAALFFAVFAAGCAVHPVQYVPAPTPVVQAPAPVYVYPVPAYVPYYYPYYGPAFYWHFGGRRHRH